METENKPFAPFGAVIHQVLIENIKLKNSLFFFCGKLAREEASKFLQSGQLALCLPSGRKMDDFRWSIKGLKLILYDTGGTSPLTLSKISYELLKNEAELIAVLGEPKGTIDLHFSKKDLRHGRHSKSGRTR